MIKRICLFTVLLVTSFTTIADDRYLVKFELLLVDKKLEWGRTIVSQKRNVWKKGYLSSYLKLSCHEHEPGKYEKRISTVDHFDGLLVTHQLISDKIEITVHRSIITPRLKEIRALAKNECKNLAPIIKEHTDTYTLPAKHGSSETFLFGDELKFHITVQ